MRGGTPATTISSLSHIFLIFPSKPSQNPCPSNIIFLKCSILQDKTFFKESKEILSIEFKFLSAMSLKIFIFSRAFSDNLGVKCRKLVYRTLIFFVNFSENQSIFLGGSMGKVIGRGM